MLVADANTGFSVPLLKVKSARVLIVDAARVTVTVYVLVVVPLLAVTTTVMVLVPTFKLMGPYAAPLADATVFTFKLASTSDSVGVILIDVTLLATDAV